MNKKSRRFDKKKDIIIVFYTVQTAQDFNLNVKEEVLKSLRRECIEVPENINDLIKWSAEEAVA
jgi:hypothetical protein